MASRRVPASILECTSPMMSALGMEWPSQRFQNRDAPDISSALRLLSRAQNRIMEALATVAVEMRGSGLPLLQSSPFQFGNFLNETLHFLVVRNGLTHSLAPDLGDANLAQLAGMTLHQVDGLVQLAVGAMAVAVGLAALAGTLGEGAAKQPLAGGQLGNAGTEAAFGSGEFGAVEWLGHKLYQYNIQAIDEKQARNRNANLLSSRAKGKTAMKSVGQGKGRDR